MSKQLDSILRSVPPATSRGIPDHSTTDTFNSSIAVSPPRQETDRIVAVVPKRLKNEMKEYIRNHPGETERTVLLKALKHYGFQVANEWMVDGRSRR